MSVLPGRGLIFSCAFNFQGGYLFTSSPSSPRHTAGHLRLPHSCQDLLKFLHLCREIRRTLQLGHLTRPDPHVAHVEDVSLMGVGVWVGGWVGGTKVRWQFKSLFGNINTYYIIVYIYIYYIYYIILYIYLI